MMKISDTLKLAPLLLGCVLAEDNNSKAAQESKQRPKEAESFLTEVPAVELDVILARPGKDNITLNIRSAKDLDSVVECGSLRQPFSVKAGQTVEVKLDKLPPGRHSYRIGKLSGEFVLARPPAQPFVFTIQADSHLDGSCVAELYGNMLSNVQADRPDFHIDLGDTFMTGKHPSKESAAKQYLAQRYHLGKICHSIPLFLVLGNHDGEEIKRPGESALAEWSMAQRKNYFSNPQPDDFYGGNPENKQNYYSWQWGDAQFVVLDPYWYSTSTRGGREMDNMQLGDKQYAWLENTLRQSRAKFKFVFIHQLTGGLGAGNRGGAEAANLHQWAKVHKMLVLYKVDVVFHGHDHFYAKQQADGVIYQLVPQSAHRNTRKHFAAEYGYREGEFLPNNGHLRVSVSAAQAKVEYVNNALPQQAGRDGANRSIKAAYVLQK